MAEKIAVENQNEEVKRIEINPDESIDKKEEEPTSADMESFRQEIADFIKNEATMGDLEVHLAMVNPVYLDYASYDMWNYYKQIKENGFPEDEVKRFEDKLLKVQRRYRPGETAQYNFLVYLRTTVTFEANKNRARVEEIKNKIDKKTIAQGK